MSVRSTVSKSRVSLGASVTVALLLVVVACALLLPSTADAKVNRRYARQYKSTVNLLLTYKTEMKKSYNVQVADLVAAHEELQAILAGDPVDDAALMEEQVYCGDTADDVMLLHRWPRDLKQRTKTFYWTARLWFSTDRDKTAFRRATRRISTGCDALSQAIDYLSQAYGALSVTPILWTVETECRSQMNDQLVKANANFKSGFSTLQALAR